MTDPVPPPEIEYPEFGDDEVEIGKQIDYLGNNGIPGMDELYRLYLSLEADEQPIDLLLVLDQSGSMAKTLAGGTANDTDADPSNDSRQKIMLDFLNGTQQSDGSYNGFIAQFLAANDDNDLAILTFDRDSSLDETKRYIYKWGDKTDHIAKTLTPSGATNYTAALWAANEIWKLEADKEAQEAEDLGSAYKAPKKIMIFLSDGEPTLAYSDGKLQNGFTADTLVGYGNVTRYENIPMALTDYFAMAFRDSKKGGDANRRSLVSNYSIIYDDAGEPYGSRCNYISGLVDDRAQFPVICKVTGMDVDAPGISDWPMGEIDADVFTPWYNEVVASAINDSDLTAYLEWEEEGIKSVGDTYDLFWLSEWAYSEFAAANEDVITYTVGFSQETDGKYGEAPAAGEEDTRRDRAEVLKYMAGTDPITGESRFFQCNTAEDLSEALNSVVLMSVTMTDKLSEYVDFASEENFEITISDAKYEGYYEDGNFAYLYTDGKFTELGEMLLDTDVTKIDADAKTVNVVFKPGVPFNEELKVEASFNVQLTEKAYDDKETTGYTATGDPLTDYDTENLTSSGEEGFFSNDNDNAKATWTRGGEHEENFPKPVVQVPDPVKIWLKKINSETIAITLDGAEFDLYREISSGKEGCITYTDENGGEHYLIKINSETLISNRDTPLELSGLRVGNYYLFETKAPNGYTRLAKPIRFVLGSDAILIDSNEQPNALVDNENLLLLKVINTSSYEFPSTGGIGTEPFYVIGALLMFGALTIGYILWRRREGRGVM